MPAIQFGGMASGLPPNIVEQLVEVERIPIKNMETKKMKSEARLKLVNELDEGMNKIKDSIGTLASVRGFNDYKLTSGDNNIVSGTVDPNSAASGSWNIEVVELAQKAAAITNGFPDKDLTDSSLKVVRRMTTAEAWNFVAKDKESNGHILDKAM